MEFFAGIIFIFFVAMFVLAAITGWMDGMESAKKNQLAAKVYIPANSTVTVEVRNSDGKPDLPFDPK